MAYLLFLYYFFHNRRKAIALTLTLSYKLGKVQNNNQLDATKCLFIFSACFEHYYAHPQEYISEYRFLVSKPGKYE
jgi:hypothetical protein